MRISQSNRVSRIPTLSTHQIDHQADLQKSSANIHSRVDDNAFSCHEIDRKGGHDATPARMPRRLAQASPQAVRYEPVQLDEKGRRYHPCGSEWVSQAWRARSYWSRRFCRLASLLALANVSAASSSLPMAL